MVRGDDGAPAIADTRREEGRDGVKRVDVTPVYVNDQDGALEFFVGELAMEKVRDDPNERVLHGGDS